MKLSTKILKASIKRHGLKATQDQLPAIAKQTNANLGALYQTFLKLKFKAS